MRGSRRDDEGFTLVEVLLSMVLVLIVALATNSALLSTQKQLGLARQRQWATAVAGAALEQLRSLPYSVVTAGLQSSDLSGDPYVVAASGGYRLSVPAAVLGSTAAIDEPLVVAGSSPPAPLYPHVSTPSATSYPPGSALPPLCPSTSRRTPRTPAPSP